MYQQYASTKIPLIAPVMEIGYRPLKCSFVDTCISRTVMNFLTLVKNFFFKDLFVDMKKGQVPQIRV